MITMKSFACICLIVFLPMVTGCEKKIEEQVVSATVATVNGEIITEADVDFMLARTFSESDLAYADENLRKKVLESLVASKVMKQNFLKEITPEQKEEISRMVKAYEEELFVKNYLQQNIAPAPVTVEMVQEYYSQHPDEFGGEIIRDVEMLKTGSLNDQQRDELLKELASLRSNKNWSSLTHTVQQKYSLEYQHALAKPGLLHPAVEQVLAQLKEGETSDLIYIDNQIYLVRVIKIQQSPPKPLANVSDEIRKKLAPMMLREAVKNTTEEVLRSADIQYVTQ
jgi:PPIC-type PPIASE domain/SurA N-terminal domain